MEQPECQHANTHDEVREHSECRYVPSSDDTRNDDDPYETVTVKDRYVICDDCGECLDCITGD